MNASAPTGRQDLTSVEHQLCDVVVALGACRKQLRRLCDNQTALENRCLAAEQGYAQCAQAYQHLFDQHHTTTTDLAATAGKCRSLEREAESAQTALLALQSLSQRSGGCGAEDAAPVKLEADCTGGSSCTHLHADIASLEKEKADLREALTRAADVIGHLNQKVDSLQSTQRETEQRQNGGLTRPATSGIYMHRDILPAGEASTKRVLRSRERKSS